MTQQSRLKWPFKKFPETLDLLDYFDLSLLVEYRPHKCILSCATASIFLKLYMKTAAHISFTRSVCQVKVNVNVDLYSASS